MATHPEFSGETYSYADAMRRVPSAWETITINGDGWSRREVRDISTPRLGHFERYGKMWVYIRANGYAVPVNEHYDTPEPPPLPKPADKRYKAGCHCGPHTCGACGQPYWIEIHGVADGYCTFCYYRG